MRGFSFEQHLNRLAGQGRRVDAELRAGVDHQGGVETCEHALSDHDRFAPDRLLGRSSDDLDLSRESFTKSSEDLSRPQSAGGDQIVPAAMSYPRQGVVLGQDADPRARAAVIRHRDEGGGKARDP